MQAAHQEPKLMIWLQLSAWSMNRNKDIVHDLVATTDTHHRPVWAHTQRPGKGLQAKQSWKVYTPMTQPYRSQILKKDLKKKGFNNVSHSLSSPLCTKSYSAIKMSIQQL